MGYILPNPQTRFLPIESVASRKQSNFEQRKTAALPNFIANSKLELATTNDFEWLLVSIQSHLHHCEEYIKIHVCDFSNSAWQQHH